MIYAGRHHWEKDSSPWWYLLSTYYVPGGIGEGEVSVPVLMRLTKARPSNIEAMFRGPDLPVSVQGAACHKALKRSSPIGEIDVCRPLPDPWGLQSSAIAKQQHDLLSPRRIPGVSKSPWKELRSARVRPLLAAVALRTLSHALLCIVCVLYWWSSCPCTEKSSINLFQWDYETGYFLSFLTCRNLSYMLSRL